MFIRDRSTILNTADSISDAGSTASSIFFTKDYDLEYDRYGYLYLSNQGGIVQYYAPEDADGNFASGHLGAPVCPLAYDKTNDQFYFFDSNYDLYVSSDGAASISLSDSNFTSWWDYVLAVDKSGYVYASAGGGAETPYIVKLSVSGSVATVVASVPYSSLGLSDGTYGNLALEDMTVKDGKLYIAAAEHYDDSGSPLHHGKIVEVELSDLSKSREIGWSSTTPTNPQTQFYGPSRFIAIAPRKLIVSDEGFDSGQIDRVVEVDLDSWTIDQIQDVSSSVNFFNTYQY